MIETSLKTYLVAVKNKQIELGQDRIINMQYERERERKKKSSIMFCFIDLYVFINPGSAGA